MSECNGIRYLSVDDIIKINKVALSFTPNELDGFRLEDNLEPTQQAPSVYRYYEQCEDIYTLAAVLYIKINKNHIFENANKRSAFIASVTFLRLNGFIFEPDEDSSIQIALNVANDVEGYNNPKLLSSWFKAFSRIAADSAEPSSGDAIDDVLSGFTLIDEQCYRD